MKRFEAYFNFINREGKDNLLSYLKKCGYFTAPASTSHHLNKEKGLVEHNCNVTERMFSQSETLDEDFSTESMAIVGLFHDLGKTGDFGKPYYVENILKSGKVSDSKPFEINKDLLSSNHAVKSMIILSRFMVITEDEEFAILHHNGLYDSMGYELKGKETPLQMLLHFSDMWVSRVTERRK